MTENSVLAREFPISINTGTTETPVWTVIEGIKSLTLAPSTKEADTNTFSNAGWDTSRVVSRGLTVTCDGLAQYDENGVKDAGQDACEGYGVLTGRAGVAEFKIELPETDDYYRFSGHVKVTEFGGDVDAVSTWKLEIKVQAQPTLVVGAGA